MADDLSVAVERLRTSTRRLNSIADTAGQLIKDVESFLEKSHVGVYASVKVGYVGDDPDSPEALICLAYRRVKSGKFRIALVEVPQHAQSEGDYDVVVRPWSECSRDEKINSLRKVPELLVELADRVNEETNRAEQVMSEVNALIHAVKKRKEDE